MYVNVFDLILLSLAVFAIVMCSFILGYKAAQESFEQKEKGAKAAVEQYQKVMHDNYYLSQSEKRWNSNYSSENSSNIFSLTSYPKEEQA
jgi:hypothetical protein